jgi:hypothetical protein
MTNHIDYEYFEWLVSQIRVDSHRTFNDLFERMHNKEFIWIVARDDNRAADGFQLRYEFFDGVHRRKYEKEDLILDGVSILEMLIALSRRIVDNTLIEDDASQWAWKLIKNLGLNRMYDPLTERKAQRVDDVLEALIWRTYERNGQRGLFPLKQDNENIMRASPHYLSDQTKVEIWYQMNSYLMELGDPR